MKYYIGEKLIRTSNRTYTHAVLGINNTEASCCGSYELALKEMAKRVKCYENNLDYWKRVLEAIENGKTYIVMKANGRNWKDSIKDYSKEYCIKMIDFYEQKLEALHISELEAR